MPSGACPGQSGGYFGVLLPDRPGLPLTPIPGRTIIRGPVMTRTLRTPRLLLEPFEDRFLTEEYVSWLNDSMTVKYSENRHRQHTLESCRQYVASFAGTPNYLWAIVLVEGADGVHIGNINAYHNTVNSLADVGILVGKRPRWGTGYGTEAWTAVCDFLLRDVGVRKVTCGTIAENRGMIGIADRVGMVADGVRPRHYLVDGREVDLVHRALYRDEWLTRYPNGYEGPVKPGVDESR